MPHTKSPGEPTGKLCPRCMEADAPVNGVQLAVIIILAVVIVVMLARIGAEMAQTRDNFVSPQAIAVYQNAGALFETTGGKPTYSEYKIRIPEADPVQYTDLRALWEKGKFTPQNVQGSL